LTAADIQILKRIPILIVVGDHFTIPQPDEACAKEIQQINGAGGDITFLSLPAIGIHGNSHMMMMDNNNLQIADILIEWIDKHVRPHMRHN
jgi:hypothetical protein